MIVQRGKHFIHYETHGDAAKPPLLLIMGLAISSKGWDRLPSLLAPDFHVVVFDNRGTGRSSRRGWIYRMRDLADDAAAVLDALGIARADVFGISMGGMVAQELVLRHPSHVRRLALGATFASYRRGHRASPADLLRLFAGTLMLRREQTLAKLLTSKAWHAQNRARAVQWIHDAENTAFRFAFAQSMAIARHHTLGRLSQVTAPTLIITGDQDRVVPHRNSEVLAQAIPGAKLVVLPGAGHVFPLEREPETIAALKQHFSA
ncbi:MAG TPA: alpha/beta fold hydrolase [Myxococcales bacterium]|nr:alpha/beta fold hydrolase [Myxococcales bacterium]